MYVPFIVSRKKENLQSIIHPLLKQTAEVGRMSHAPGVRPRRVGTASPPHSQPSLVFQLLEEYR